MLIAAGFTKPPYLIYSPIDFHRIAGFFSFFTVPFFLLQDYNTPDVLNHWLLSPVLCFCLRSAPMAIDVGRPLWLKPPSRVFPPRLKPPFVETLSLQSLKTPLSFLYLTVVPLGQ
ncbi:hypothetical protein RIF29_30444 [Crotalaria pallida]|uniref:Uncharacterized protein n=1 Tax=Crotalaria pallida TaxID=3830 RepID=A0AAN9EGF7_CROPI